MAVRAATREDVPAIWEIYNEAILTTIGTAEYVPVSLESRLKWFDDRVASDYPILVYEAERVVGYAVLSAWVPREGYRFTAESAVYVAESARGGGVATQLMTALVAEARLRGYRSLVARVATENTASLRVHERVGFVEIGRLPAVVYKFDRWIDIVMMQLRLDEPSKG
jgi:phosphinothricin acetyltransferase